jgi:hypothetical protein
MLLEHGADMTVVGGEGTPRDVALRAKLPEMMALLDKEGKHSLSHQPQPHTHHTRTHRTKTHNAVACAIQKSDD